MCIPKNQASARVRENRVPSRERSMFSDDITISEHCPSNEWSWQRPKRMTLTRKRGAPLRRGQ